MKVDESVKQHYGNRVRTRVTGLCWDGTALLLINHRGLRSGPFWAPPGGGVEFGETLHDSLKREFREETGLDVEVGRFLFGCEFLEPPLHAVELFFEVFARGGVLHIGQDPELPVLEEARYFSQEDLMQLNAADLHGIFKVARSEAEFRKLSGFYRI